MSNATQHLAALSCFRAIAALPVDQLPPNLKVPRASTSFQTYIRTPGSKSLSNRAVLLASLAAGRSVLRGALVEADDAQRMLEAAGLLGAMVQHGPPDVTTGGPTVEIVGVGGAWKPTGSGNEVKLNLNNAGTAVRFLAGAALLSPVPVLIDGNHRMRQRPIAELGDLLGKLGCRVEYLGNANCPPVRITPPADINFCPSSIEIGSTHSSQFASALLLAAPWLPHGITLRFIGETTSVSYVRMTTGLLARLGATVQESADGRVVRVSGRLAAKGLAAFSYDVEPDASGATYFWAAAALIPGSRANLAGLGSDSLQGDCDFPQMLRRMGCEVGEQQRPGERTSWVLGPRELQPLLADMSEMPDAAMTLASVAAFASGTSILRGLKTLRVKETDRIAALQEQLIKIGVQVATNVANDPDAVTITPPPGGIDCGETVAPVYFDTYDDHRMAMALSLIGLRRPNVFIKDPACVRKTYPTFWRDWAAHYAV